MGGVPSTLVDAYVYEATQEATIKEKDLAKGKILTAYFDRIIDKTTALELAPPARLLGPGRHLYARRQ